jgi:hypothetical protein
VDCLGHQRNNEFGRETTKNSVQNQLGGRELLFDASFFEILSCGRFSAFSASYCSRRVTRNGISLIYMTVQG